MRFGDPSSATSTIIKAESRRLMIEKVETAPGKFETRTFTVNVRKPAISTGDTKSPNAGPFTSYKANLKQFVEAARSKGGIPVLVTPMERRRWKGNEPEPTLTDYAEAVRQVGTEDKVPVIDLNSMSLKFYSALRP